MTKARDLSLAAKAPIASPSFTGTTAANKLNVTGVVDNTISGTLVVKGSLSANQTSGLALFQQSSTASTIKAFGPDATTTGILNTYVAASDGSPDSLITSVTANGLTFNGDTAAANALNDYEEGTWTPSFGGGMTITYGSRTASYTKVGQSVTWNCSIQWSSKSGGSGNVTVSLPFAVNATGQWQGGAGCGYAGGITQTIRGSGYSESNAASCYLSSAASNSVNIQVSQMAASGHLIMGGSFQTSS